MSIEKDLANKVLELKESAKTAIAAPGKLRVAAIVLVIVLIAVLWHTWQRNTANEEKLKQAIAMTEQQAVDRNYLENELKVNRQNAEMLAAFMGKVQAGQVQPVAHFNVEAPDVEGAIQKVIDRLNSKDKTLPKAALADADNNIVTPRPLTDKEKEAAVAENKKREGTDQPKVNEEYGIDVVKNNNYRNWYIGTGLGVHKGDIYLPVSAQRNFSKDAALEAQIHVDNNLQEVNGGQLMYKRAVNKLLYFF